jgi:hypothetical protein
LCFNRRIASNNCVRDVGYSHTCDQDGKCILVIIYGDTSKSKIYIEWTQWRNLGVKIMWGKIKKLKEVVFVLKSFLNTTENRDKYGLFF